MAKKKRLTDLMIEKLKAPPPGKQVDHHDAGMPGLSLRVNYGGAKVWRATYYVKKVGDDGKKITYATTHKLGRYPILKVKQAREAARAFLVDPHKALVQADADTFREVADNFIRRHVDQDRDEGRTIPLRTKPEIVRCLNKYVLPYWQHRTFRDIKRSDVTNLLDDIAEKNGPRQSGIVFSIIRKIMNWHALRTDDYVCPIARGTRRAKTSRNRVLDEGELRALWKACDECNGTFGAAVKVLLLTAQRKQKVAEMRWTDIENGVWTIPSEPREKSNAGSLRLPQVVLGIIAAQPRIAGNDYVFAGRGAAAFASYAQRKDEVDAKIKPALAPWTIHDLRRTAKTLMAAAGVRPDISERVLGHSIKGVEGVYDRHTYDGEKADALVRLAAKVEGIVNPPEGNQP